MDKLQLVKLMVKINDDRDEIAFSNLFDFFSKIKGLFCTKWPFF